jgi:hypothetical protein
MPQNITLYDSFGKEIFRKENATRLNLSALSNGIYLLRTDGGDVERIVKIK